MTETWICKGIRWREVNVPFSLSGYYESTWSNGEGRTLTIQGRDLKQVRKRAKKAIKALEPIERHR